MNSINNDYSDIRNIVSFVAQIIAGAAIGYGAMAIVSALSLGIAMAIVVWFLMMCISCVAGVCIDYVVQTRLTNQRVVAVKDAASSVYARARGLFSKKAVA